MLRRDLRGTRPCHRARATHLAPGRTDRAAAERLAARLAVEEQGRADAARALTFGAYLTGQWLPGKKLRLATTTYRGYEPAWWRSQPVVRHALAGRGRAAGRPPPSDEMIRVAGVASRGPFVAGRQNEWSTTHDGAASLPAESACGRHTSDPA